MTDRMLSDLLDDAGSRISVSPAPLPVIISQATRRRRLRAVSWFGAITVSVALVIAGGATWLPGSTGGSAPPSGDDRPPVAGHTSADGRADLRVELPRAEVERRCTIVWRNLYGPDVTSVELRDDDTGPWFEGDVATVANWQEFGDYGGFKEPLYGDGCVIPQAGLVDTAGTVGLPLPESDDDEAGVRAACGRFLGWDFSGWQVLSADSGDHRLAAVLRSTDGHMANCQLDTWYVNDRGRLDLDRLYADPYRAETPHVEIATEAKLRADVSLGLKDYWVHPSFDLGCQREPPGDWVADCLGVGWVSGPQPAARIVITDVTGTEHEIAVVDRWYAFAGTVINHADVPEGGCPPPPNVCDDTPGELHFTVYAADGTVLAKYDEDEDLPLIT